MHFRNRSSMCATNPFSIIVLMGRRWRYVDKPSLMISQELSLHLNLSVNFTWQILRLFWRHKLNMFVFCVDSASLSVLVQPHINIWNHISTRGRTFAKLLRNFHLKTAVTGITELKEEENADYKHVHRSRCYGRYYSTRCVLMYFDLKRNAKNVRLKLRSDLFFVFFASTQLCAPHITLIFRLKLVVFLYFWYKTHDHLGTSQMSQLSWRKQSRRSRTHWWQSLSRRMPTGKRSTWRLSPKLLGYLLSLCGKDQTICWKLQS